MWWCRVPYNAYLPPQSFSEIDMLTFFFKKTLDIYKIQNGKSKIWTSNRLHLGEKLCPHLCFPGSVRISYRNVDTIFVFLQGWKIVLWKDCALCPVAEKSGVLFQLDRPLPAGPPACREYSEQKLICSWIQFSWKQCSKEWWLAAALAVFWSTWLSLQVGKLLYCAYT